MEKYSDCLKIHRRFYIRGWAFHAIKYGIFMPATEHKNSDRKQFRSMEKLSNRRIPIRGRKAQGIHTTVVIKYRRNKRIKTLEGMQ